MLAVLQEVAHRRPYEVLILLKPIHHPSSKQLPPSHVVQHQTLHKDSVSTSMSDEGGRDIAAFADPPASKYQASEAKLSSSSGASDCNLQGPDVRFQGHQSAARERARASSKLPNGLVMVTVPGQHSRKPQLAHLLRPYLPAKPKCLEVGKMHTARTAYKTSYMVCDTSRLSLYWPDYQIVLMG